MYLSLSQQTKLALGSDATLSVVTDYDNSENDVLFKKLWHQIFQFEKQFSRFIPMSELSTFNRAAGLKTLITTDFKNLLLAAKDLGEKTDGLYNPFILPALQRAGYKNSAAPGYENDPVDDHSSKKVVGVDKLTIGSNWALIPYGTSIDMGGCGKGYLADLLRKTLDSKHIHGYWLSMGGDIATFGHDDNGENWTVNIQNANELAGISDWNTICPQSAFAVATSGTFRRKNQSSDKNWHHIIDPKTLQPASTDVRLATVCTNSSLVADVMASCAIILGSKKSFKLLKQQGISSALLQCQVESETYEKHYGNYISNNRVKSHA